MQDFQRLTVWQKAHALAVQAHLSLPAGLDRRHPGMSSQLRRSAAAIPANIAEGCGHASPRELARFLQIAMASAHELQYHLILGRDLGVLPSAAFAKLEARTEQVKRMLTGLLKRVRADADRREQRPSRAASVPSTVDR